MSIVAGVDFGTLSVRVSIFDSARGKIGSGNASYPLHRKREDPDFATQSHEDHMYALVEAMRCAIASAKINGADIASTGSSVIPVGENLTPLSDYYLCCDHPSWREAELISKTARENHLPAIDWCGGMYSSECQSNGPIEWDFAQASPYQSAPSMLIGMQLGPV